MKNHHQAGEREYQALLRSKAAERSATPRKTKLFTPQIFKSQKF